MVFLHNLTMAEILCRIVAALLFSGLCGGILVSVLRMMGDRHAVHEGRWSFNPFTHVALSGVFLAIAFRAAWMAPLPARRGGERSLKPLLAVLITLGALCALVPLLDLARPVVHAALPRSLGYMVLAEIEVLQRVLAGSVMIGLLPVPGMLMGQALTSAFPQLEKRYRRWQGFGMAGIAILFILDWMPETAPLLALLRLV